MTLEERIEALEKEIQKLNDIEAIKQLKAKYFRCLDGKLWDELETTLSPNIETSYSDGKLVFHSPKEITEYLAAAMPKEEISMHMGHTPEITIDSETTATGRWYLEDNLIFTDGKYKNVGINGGAFYTDKYEKIDGQWFIKETGYVRIFEEHFMRDPKIHITSNMHKEK